MIKPYTSIFCFAIFSFFVALKTQIYVSNFAPLLLLIFLKFNHIFAILKKLIFLNLFIIIVVLSVLLYQNYDLALLIFIRSNLIILFGLLLFHNTNSYDIAFGIRGLGFGDKACYLFYFCIRFIRECKRDFDKLKRTLKVRAFRHKTSIFTYQIYANLVAMLFLSAFKKSQMLEKTMQIRGFNGKFYKFEDKIKLGFYDILLMILVLISIIFKKGEII